MNLMLFLCNERNHSICYTTTTYKVHRAASIKCYFDRINLKKSCFCTAYSFKILASKRKYKNNLKNRESQKIIFYNLCNDLQRNPVVLPRS